MEEKRGTEKGNAGKEEKKIYGHGSHGGKLQHLRNPQKMWLPDIEIKTVHRGKGGELFSDSKEPHEGKEPP